MAGKKGSKNKKKGVGASHRGGAARKSNGNKPRNSSTNEGRPKRSRRR